MNKDENRGFESESRVELALRHIQENPELNKEARIAEIIHAERHSKLDRLHTDFELIRDSGEAIPLQVKSSTRACRHFEKRNKFHKKYIPVIVVFPGEALESIISKVIECVKTFYAKTREHLRRLTEASPRSKKRQWCQRERPAFM